MGRFAVVILVGTLVACASSSGAGSLQQPRSMSPEEAAAHEDSIRSIVRAYEEGTVALDVATQAMADLIEPTGGFAVQGDQDPRARELFEATGRELRRRQAERLGVPDSLARR